MDVRHRWRILCLVSSAVLCACAKDHSDSLPAGKPEAGTGAAGKAGESSAADSGHAGEAPKPTPKPGKSGVVGAKAVAKLEPVGEATADPDNALRGTATFSVTESGVDLAILVRQCPRSGAIDLSIQEGGDCSEATLTGPHWDSPRGEGIPKVVCLGVSGQGRGALTRLVDDPKPWSIGGADKSELLQHAVVVYDSGSGAPIACGVITREESGPEPSTADLEAASSAPLLGRAVVAGLCLGGLIARNNDQACPDPKELTDCAQQHCQLDACVAQCGEFIACTTKEEDPCSVAYTCPIDAGCSTCSGTIQQCMFSFCADTLACASPVSPDGPCSQLRACCGLQGDMTESCLETVQLVEKLSGDPSCFGLMQDWDFFSHLPVPCMFE